jgi:hypothetical protein
MSQKERVILVLRFHTEEFYYGPSIFVEFLRMIRNGTGGARVFRKYERSGTMVKIT